MAALALYKSPSLCKHSLHPILVVHRVLPYHIFSLCGDSRIMTHVVNTLASGDSFAILSPRAEHNHSDAFQVQWNPAGLHALVYMFPCVKQLSSPLASFPGLHLDLDALLVYNNVINLMDDLCSNIESKHWGWACTGVVETFRCTSTHPWFLLLNGPWSGLLLYSVEVVTTVG